MNTKLYILVLLCVALLVACGGGEAAETADISSQAPAAEAPIEDLAQEEAELFVAATPAPTAAPAIPEPLTGASSEWVVPVAPQGRMIVKDGRISITVAETETAVNRISFLVVEVGGYIITQQVYDDDQGYRYATMQLAVPVDRFEESLRTLRTLGQVIDESASGVDVSDEFVDLNSRLDNLEATRLRLVSFLEAATSTDQRLRVNEQIKAVEGEMAVIEGRINYLRDRSSFSTIDVALIPWIPTPTITPTPTNTPTATPTTLPQARDWQPGVTVKVASVQFQNTSQVVADTVLYNAIICGPWLLLLALLGYPAWRIYRQMAQVG